MLNFCTLFNTGYLAKGLAMHASLLAQCPEMHLYIFAFDDDAYGILQEMALQNTTVIGLAAFENQQLLEVKAGRSFAEYCWTCTPSTVRYCIDTFGLSNCTYVDADICFYSDPKVLIDGMGNDSVLITPHNYHPLYDHSAAAGIYCVQFITFRNDDNGNKVLNWWLQACLKWCYAYFEDGKLGDQKYLDSWPYMFDGVHICRHPGAGVAPWNALKFTYGHQNGKLTVDGQPIIFYHFHDLRYLSNGSWFIGGYDIPEIVSDQIYQPYISELIAINERVQSGHAGCDTLSTIDAGKVNALTTKYKVGTYVMDVKRSFGKFISDLFFTGKRKHYKSNYLRL